MNPRFILPKVFLLINFIFSVVFLEAQTAKKDTIFKKLLIPEDYTTGWKKLALTYEYSGILGADGQDQVYAWQLDNNENKWKVGIFNVNGRTASLEIPEMPLKYFRNKKNQDLIVSSDYGGHVVVYEVSPQEIKQVAISSDELEKWDKKDAFLGEDDLLHMTVNHIDNDRLARVSFYNYNEGKWNADEFPEFTFPRNDAPEYSYIDVLDLMVTKTGQPFLKIKERGIYYLYTLTAGKWEKLFEDWQIDFSLFMDQNSILYYGTPLCHNCDHEGKLYTYNNTKIDSFGFPNGEVTDILLKNGMLHVFTTGEDRSERNIYQFTGAAWKYQSKFRLLESTILQSEVFFNDSTFFCYYDHAIYAGINRLTSASHTLTQKMYPIALPPGLVLSPDEKLALSNFKFISQEGKTGICNKSGQTLVYPYFNTIEIEKASENPGTVNFILKTGGMDFTVNSKMLLHPDKIPGLETKEITCENCKGEGKLPDHTEKIEIEGKYVEEKTKTSTESVYENVWDPSCNCYNGVRTTITSGTVTPGHYEPSTFEYKKVPGGTCNKCKGEGKFIQHSFLVWNWHRGAYEKIWK